MLAFVTGHVPDEMRGRASRAPGIDQTLLVQAAVEGRDGVEKALASLGVFLVGLGVARSRPLALGRGVEGVFRGEVGDAIPPASTEGAERLRGLVFPGGDVDENVPDAPPGIRINQRGIGQPFSRPIYLLAGGRERGAKASQGCHAPSHTPL